jgi:hypothetical protein
LEPRFESWCDGVYRDVIHPAGRDDGSEEAKVEDGGVHHRGDDIGVLTDLKDQRQGAEHDNE